jgi:hypothetical protein
MQDWEPYFNSVLIILVWKQWNVWACRSRLVMLMGCMTNRCKNIWQVNDIYSTLGVMGVLLVCVLKLTVCAPRVLVATQVFFHLYNFLQ